MSDILTFPIFETRAVTMAKATLLDRVLGIVDAGVSAFAGLLNKLAWFSLRSLTTGLGAEDQRKRTRILEEAQASIAGVLIVSDFWGRHQVYSKAKSAGVEIGGGGGGGGAPSGPPPDDFGAGEFEYPEGPHDIRVTVNEGMDEELPKIPNREAIADIVSRTPILAQPVSEGGPKWLQIAKAYAEEHAFGLAKSADLEVTKRVQRHIDKVLEDGGTVDEAARTIAEIGDFTQSYAETVFRTNAASAFTAGAFRQVRDPETNYAFPAFKFEAVHDASTRPNHRAADGMIAATNDPVWSVWAPPCGYRCRCSLRLMSREELERAGLLKGDRVRPYYPAGIRTHAPDAGFGQGSVLTRFGSVPI